MFRHTDGAVRETQAAGAGFRPAEIGPRRLWRLDNTANLSWSPPLRPARLLLNQATHSPAGAHWLQVRLEQAGGNRFGIGAWVGVERAGRPTLFRRVRTDGSYLSASDLRVHFGLGASGAPSAVVVQWPDGHRERWAGVAIDRVVTLRRAAGK